jgi:class 3 adenylate cyclase
MGVATMAFNLNGFNFNQSVLDAQGRVINTWASKVQASRSTLDCLTKSLFIVEDRGEIEVKGKGKMRTAFLTGYSNPALKDRLEVVIEKGEPVKTPCGEFKPGEEKEDGIVVNGTTVPKIVKSYTNMSMLSAGLADDDSDLGGPTALEDDHRTSRTSKRETLGLTAALPALNAALKRDWFEEDPDASHHHHSNRRVSHWRGSGDALSNISRRVVQFHRMFLFVSPAYKAPTFLDRLAEDKPAFEECMLQDRMSFARNLTLVWLLMLSIVSAIDYYLDVVDNDADRYRSALIARVVGNQVIGLLYLLFLASPELFQLYAQSISVLMLLAQGASLLACAVLVYNNESSVIALFGVYAMSYTVCTIFQRLTITFLSAVAYAIVEIYRCDLESATNKGVSIVFLFTLFSFIACGIRLEEFMEHVSHFEGRRIATRVEEIRINKQVGSELLLSLLPSHVVPLVRDCVSPIAEHHKDVTIIFTDIKGFTQYSSGLSPVELMRFLNQMYSAFDEVILNWELYKVEIIGDAYFISAGCPKPSNATRTADEWAMRAVEVALALQRTMPQVCDDPQVKMRVGLHTGSVVAGVVGKKGPRYHLFGPTVAYAEKMESHGEPSRVHISDDTHSLLKEGNHEYDFEERTIQVEGEGVQRTWFVNKSNSKAAQQVARGLIVQRRKSTGRNR